MNAEREDALALWVVGLILIVIGRLARDRRDDRDD